MNITYELESGGAPKAKFQNLFMSVSSFVPRGGSLVAFVASFRGGGGILNSSIFPYGRHFHAFQIGLRRMLLYLLANVVQKHY